MRANLRILLALSFVTLCQGCISRSEIRAAIWLHNGLPADVCEREPVLKDHGFYRRLDGGKFEFISFCDPESKHWLSMYDRDFENLLDKTLPKEAE
jgi:hypothetical protein